MDVKLPETRQAWLANRLATGAPLVATEVAEALGVSVDTIRRDIAALEAGGLARRVRGGAMPVKPPDAPMAEKLAGAGPSPALVAAVAAQVGSAQTLLLDGGRTGLALAETLTTRPGLLVMTPSPWVATACNARGLDVFLIGGPLAPGASITDGAFDRLAADMAVLGACGLDAGFGLSADRAEEARAKRAMAGAVADVVVPVSAAKLGLRARFQALPVDAIGTVVTDAPRAATGALEEAGVEVIHV